MGSHSDRTGERRWHVAGPAFLAALGWGFSIWHEISLVSFLGLVLAQAAMMSMWAPFWSLATGFLGLFLQQFLPRLLTTRIQSEAPFEQIPHLCTVMRRRADRLIDEIQVKLPEETRPKVREFYTVQVRPFLAEAYERSSPLATPIQATGLFGRFRSLPGLDAVNEKLVDLETCCNERRQLGEQERLHYLLHGWLLVHVPLSLILLVLGIAHAVMSMYY